MPHIIRLTRAVEGQPRALAVAVYSEPRNGRLEAVPAASAGYEGVACVDDAARAAMLALRLDGLRADIAMRDLAVGYLRFVQSMQQPDGTFANFISDWHGTPNLRGPTSYPGGEWWFARAMHALAVGAHVAPDVCLPALAKGMERLAERFSDSRVQAIALLALLAARRAMWDVATTACLCAGRRLAGQVGDGLEVRTWLWGEIQEGALAKAAAALGDSALARTALGSAQGRFARADALLLSAETMTPYDAGAIAWSSRALYEISGDGRWLGNIAAAGRWLYGSNSANAPIYEEQLGLVRDGIDSRNVSPNSGAESNIEGQDALLNFSWWREGK
jgi:hypothetical protein